MVKNTSTQAFIEILNQLGQFADMLRREQGIDVVEWLETTLRKIDSATSPQMLQAISIERNDTSGIKSIGRSRMYCRYRVVFELQDESIKPEAIHFFTSVAECIYLILLIASSAYENNEGGFPRKGHMVFVHNSRQITNWIRKAVGKLYLPIDVDTMVAKLDKDENVYQAMSKIRKMFKEMNLEQAAFEKQDPHNGNFYRLADTRITIKLPDELRRLGIELRNIVEL